MRVFENKGLTAIESDIVSVSTAINLDKIDAAKTNCFVGVQFFDDVDGKITATPDSGGKIAITIQTYNSHPLFEQIPVGIIATDNIKTLSWSANTTRVKAVPSGITNASFFKIIVTCNEGSSNNSTSIGESPLPLLPVTIFDEVLVAEKTPLVQIIASYGLLDNTIGQSALTGSFSDVDDKFQVSSGVDADGFASLTSEREGQYKAGQGLEAEFTAVFDIPKSDNIQLAGMLSAESAIIFGYNGLDFGVMLANRGRQSIYELTVTAGAAAPESATVTVDGTAYIVPLTAGTAYHNAFEVAESLNSQVNGFDFTSNETIVCSLSVNAQFGSGLFDFASATATAAWVEIAPVTALIETWISQSEWIGEPVKFTPQLGNVFKIQLGFLGFDGVAFQMKNPVNNKFVTVHTLRYANTSTDLIVNNPIFRAGWVSRNRGNTTDVKVQGGSAALFIQGKKILTGRPRGKCVAQASIGTTSTNVLAIRNRLVFTGRTNKSELIPLILNFSSESSKTTIFEIIANPVFAEPVQWTFHNPSLSLAEFAVDQVEVTGGDTIACFTTKNAPALVDMEKLLDFMIPTSSIAIVARTKTGASSDIDITFTWKDDL